jgi:hypothetical protein
MIEDWKYQSNAPTPSLADCLRWTQLTIHIVYKDRAELRRGVTVAAAWNGICDWLGSEKQNSASRLVNLVDAPWTGAPEPIDALSLATAFWVEAAHAHDRGDPDRSWAALLQANYYLGMASGPETSAERSSLGGSGKKDNFELLRKLLLRWLGRLPEQSFTSAKEAREAVLPKVEKLCKRFRSRRSTNPMQLMKDWTEDREDVRQAFERLVRGGIKPGRKKAADAGVSGLPRST